MARSSYRSSRDYFSPWPEYVPVAERQRKASAQIEKLSKPGKRLSPVRIEGRTIASSTWGKAWCVALEAQADLVNRLGRGRSYVRNGCVIDLKIDKNVVEALISGSEVYRARLEFKALPAARWRKLVQACAGQVGSLVELLRGKVSHQVMAIMAQPGEGLFPQTGDLSMRCSCPDGAWMCKHLAAVLYGIGNRLDAEPEQLFSLRGVDASDLLSVAPPSAPTLAPGRALLEGDLSALFGVDLDLEPSPLSQLPPSMPTAPSAVTSATVSKGDAKRADARKTAAPRAAAPRTPARKTSATSAGKTSTSGQTPGASSRGENAPVRRAVAKKASVKKAVAKKASVKKAVAKKAVAKKVVAKKVVAKKVVAKKVVAKKASAKKVAAREATSRKSEPGASAKKAARTPRKWAWRF